MWLYSRSAKVSNLRAAVCCVLYAVRAIVEPRLAGLRQKIKCVLPGWYRYKVSLMRTRETFTLREIKEAS